MSVNRNGVKIYKTKLKSSNGKEKQNKARDRPEITSTKLGNKGRKKEMKQPKTTH